MSKLLKIVLILFSLTQISFARSGWFQLTSGTSMNLSSICFLNPNTGWVAGNGGTILATTNGGINWIQQTSGTSRHLSSIYFSNTSTGWAVGDSGIILATTNAGTNWIRQSGTPPFTYLHSVYFINSTTGWAVGDNPPNGIVLKTRNGGLNWSVQTIPGLYYLRALHFLDANTGWVAGDSAVSWGLFVGVLYKTSDGGLNWIKQRHDSQHFLQINSAYFINTAKGFIIDFYYDFFKSEEHGRILITYDGGASWQLKYYDMLIFNSIHFPNSTSGWVVGSSGEILATSNGGENWITQSSLTTNTLISVCFPNSSTGYIAGNNGTILKTTDGGGFLTGIHSISNELPYNFKLYQNYPNPFNPATNIKFNLAKSSMVKLIVYDVLGREIEELINKELKAGTYEADWEGSNYPSGIYFYSFAAGDYNETKKMILIK